jgi:HTH-type transcriptional repressor of NAD biosynthesis genes
MGCRSPDLEAIAVSHRHDLCLLKSCGLPFVQDGLRDGETIRQWMTMRFEDVLTECGLRWVQISGRHDQRHSAAISEVEKLLA